MASIDSGAEQGHKKGPGVKRAKKLSTRVDMTPMVDLGFLLITFFVFTATMSTPTALDLRLPKDTDKVEEQAKVKETSTLTILLGKQNRVFYYEGLQEDAVSQNKIDTSNYKAIRDVIIKKKTEVVSRYKSQPDRDCEQKARNEGQPANFCADKEFVVIIKPSDDATYKNVVDILDEMAINKVISYSLNKIMGDELNLIKNK